MKTLFLVTFVALLAYFFIESANNRHLAHEAEYQELKKQKPVLTLDCYEGHQYLLANGKRVRQLYDEDNRSAMTCDPQ